MARNSPITVTLTRALTQKSNLIKHGSKYWQNEVFGLLFCTCRIRSTHNTHFPSFESEDEAFHIDVSLLERASNVHN
jgi:hypothetical protein